MSANLRPHRPPTGRRAPLLGHPRRASASLLLALLLLSAGAHAQDEPEHDPDAFDEHDPDEHATDEHATDEHATDEAANDEAGGMTTLGTMPPEAPRGEPPRLLARPFPRPEGADATLLRDVEQLERVLADYESEVNEFRDDLARVVRREYEQRRGTLRRGFDDEIEALRYEERERRLDAIGRIEEFLRRYPNHPPETPDAMFRLAELYFEKESDEYVLADQVYSQQLDLYDGGQLQQLPPEPEKDYGVTIATFQRLVTSFPDYRQVDGAYYLLGYAHLQMGDEAEAVGSFMALVNRFPDSSFAQESWIRIGEHHFEVNEYASAAAAYQRALDYGDGRLYDEALFKLGWSHYLTNRYDDAIERFSDLIAYYRQHDGGEGAGALREEALQYIAVTLAEEDWDLDGRRDAEAGLPRVRHWLTTGADWERDVTERLATVWFDAERYDLAIELYRMILQRWPWDRENPQRHERIVAALSRQRDVEAAFVEQRRMSGLYGPGSEWFEAQEEQGNIRAMAYAEDLVRNVLLDTARYFNAQADEARDRAGALGDAVAERLALQRYSDAAGAYGDFLAHYPSDREAYEVRFLYAQALYYSFEFLDAAHQYGLVRDAAAQTSRQELAAFQVVKSLELAIEEEIEAFELPPRSLPNYRGRRTAELARDDATGDDPRAEPAQVIAPEPIPELTQELVRAYDTYVTLRLNSDEDPTT
jgi:cellulose synthase operon protein C